MAELSMDDLMFKPGLMKGQRILITGGGTGLGKVMAEACLMLGAEVYIWGRRGGVVEDTAKELMDAHGGKMHGIACDIRVPEAIHDAMDRRVKQDFTEFEAHLGVGAELRFKWLAIEAEARGVSLWRNDSEQPAAYYTDTNGTPVPQSSQGIQGTLGAMFWF